MAVINARNKGAAVTTVRKISGLLTAASCSVLAVDIQADPLSEATDSASGSAVNMAPVKLNDKPNVAADKSVDSKADENSNWRVKTAVLSYSEEGRIQVNQALLKVTRESDSGSLQFKLDTDTVTGPSMNAAVPSSEVQTFSNPSGSLETVTAAGELPEWVIESHRRSSVSVNKEDILNSDYSINYGARYSYELSYKSKSITAGISRNFDRKNTQLSFSTLFEDAEVLPIGGVVKPGEETIIRADYADEAEFKTAWNNLRTGESEKKRAYELVTGITQVINRDAIVQLNYSYGQVNGYQNDALKLVSIIDANGNPEANVYENRPDHRERQSVYIHGKYSLAKNQVFDLSYRYYWDDWSINSHTVAAGWQFELGSNWKLEPQVRWYKQSSADFFQQSIFADGAVAVIPDYMSADYRLAATNNYTVGVNLDYKFDSGKALSMRLALYEINPEDDSSSKRGRLNDIDLTPTIRSTVFMMSYDF